MPSWESLRKCWAVCCVWCVCLQLTRTSSPSAVLTSVDSLVLMMTQIIIQDLGTVLGLGENLRRMKSLGYLRSEEQVKDLSFWLPLKTSPSEWIRQCLYRHEGVICPGLFLHTCRVSLRRELCLSISWTIHTAPASSFPFTGPLTEHFVF